jgi:hypothetical protein
MGHKIAPATKRKTASHPFLIANTPLAANAWHDSLPLLRHDVILDLVVISSADHFIWKPILGGIANHSVVGVARVIGLNWVSLTLYTVAGA